VNPLTVNEVVRLVFLVSSYLQHDRHRLGAVVDIPDPVIGFCNTESCVDKMTLEFPHFTSPVVGLLVLSAVSFSHGE